MSETPTLTPEQLLAYAKDLAKRHNGLDIEALSVWELWPDYAYGTPLADHDINDADYDAVLDILSTAEAVVVFPETDPLRTYAAYLVGLHGHRHGNPDWDIIEEYWSGDEPLTTEQAHAVYALWATAKVSVTFPEESEDDQPQQG